MSIIPTAFFVNPQTGLLSPARQCLSPHYDARPMEIAIDMIVIHGISLPPGIFGGETVEHFFCGKWEKLTHPALAELQSVTVSAHILIKRTGEIVQFVPFTARAWHAGESSFQGRERCNDFSVGIELEGTDVIPYTMTQYHQLSQIIIALQKAYPAITLDRIVGHSDIAPHRKTDPGPVFEWVYLKGLLSCA